MIHITRSTAPLRTVKFVACIWFTYACSFHFSGLKEDAASLLETSPRALETLVASDCNRSLQVMLWRAWSGFEFKNIFGVLWIMWSTFKTCRSYNWPMCRRLWIYMSHALWSYLLWRICAQLELCRKKSVLGTHWWSFQTRHRYHHTSQGQYSWEGSNAKYLHKVVDPDAHLWWCLMQVWDTDAGLRGQDLYLYIKAFWDAL